MWRKLFVCAALVSAMLLVGLFASAPLSADNSVAVAPAPQPVIQSEDVSSDAKAAQAMPTVDIRANVPTRRELPPQNPPWANQPAFADKSQPLVQPRPPALWDVSVPARQRGIESVGDWDSNRVNFPRVIFDAGQYRMWYDGYNPLMGYQVGLAESGDGITWTKHASNPLVGAGDPGEWDSLYRGQLAILKDGSLYKMWFSGGPDSGPWQTGYATSTNGLDWNIYPGNPVLPAGGSGDWDEMESDGPTVILDGGIYKMWYHGCNADYSVCSIGYATSTNGIDWSKYGGNPVLTPGNPGDWDEGGILWPYVVKNGGVYEMWYDSNGQIGLATSPDGIVWTKSASNPVLTTGWDGVGVIGQSVLLEGSTFRMWFRSGTGANLGIGYAESTDGIVWTMPYSNPVLRPGAPNMAIEVNYPHNWAHAYAAPNATVVITVANGSGIKATITGQSDWQGYFDSGWANWDPEHPNIQPGDIVTATAAGQTTVVSPIGTLAGAFDADTELVSGVVNAPWFTTVDVRCEVWAANGPAVTVADVDANGGSFQCSFDGLWDLQPWEMVAVRYIEPDSDSVINILPPLQLLMGVNYGHNWVEGNYEAGHTLWITLTESDGTTIKDTAVLQTGEVPWWGGQTGFSTNWQGWTSGQWPDIAPGDWVYGLVDNGYTATVRVGTFDGELDIDNDLVTATLYANWFTQPLNASCNVENGPGEGFMIDPDGGVHVTDFFTMGWDLQPGQNVWLWYREPDGDWVGNVVREPAPDVGVWKWNIGGFARPGGVYVYGVYYVNNGDGVATDVSIVDTLPLSTTWAGDTSGLTPAIGPNGVITWNLGDLQPGEYGAFMVTLGVDNDVPTGAAVIEPNCVFIATSAIGDNNPGNDNACAGPVDVWEDELDINVAKWPNPGDPAPGQEFEYRVRWCAGQGAAAGPAWLTETLPVSTTLLSWRPQNWWERYWVEAANTGHQLALYAPGLPGHMCQDLYLRLLVDPSVPVSTTLVNTVVITTAGDPDWNNTNINADAHVSGPRYDLQIDKSVHRSVPIPGGWINYFVRYENRGNVAAHAWVTDTVPPGLSYQYAYWGGGQPGQNEPLPAPTIIGDQIIWDLGELPVNGSRWFHIQMNVSGALSPGDTITNCATVGLDGDEDTPDDNTSCYPVTLNEPGPNLQVTKQHNWNGDWQLRYQIRFDNTGDQAIDDVWITDTLPLFTASDGWWQLDWMNQDRVISVTLENGVFKWLLDYLDPGEAGWLQFNANLDSPGQPLRWYTNTVEITTPPGDVNADDNIYSDVAFSGGEVQWVDLDIYRTRIWGCAYSTPITITGAAAQMVIDWGNCWNVEFGETFDPGDVVTIEAGAAVQPVVIHIPAPFTAQASSITDTVWGQIDALDHHPLDIDLWGFPTKHVQTDGGGHYSASFADVPRGAQGDVNYYATIDYAQVGFHRRFQTPDMILQVNYGHDWINVAYELGHTVWLTVTDSGGNLKATASGPTQIVPEWGGWTGFTTIYNGWTSNHPDLAPGDRVYGRISNGQTTQLQVGEVTGTIDVADDNIGGRIYAPWFTQTLEVQCHPWGGVSAPGKNSSAGPNGDPPYFCQWNPVTEWDIVPGQEIGVWYIGPDRNWVCNVFHEPAPRMRVEKWAEGNPAEGSNFIFRVQYRNEGDADAENVVITDTMLGGMVYLTDTSGLPHSGVNPVVWDLGTVPPGDWIQFDVFVGVTAIQSETITNTVRIATSNPYDRGGPGEKYSQWSGHVGSNDTQLNIGKWAWTDDPAPGYDVVFTVQPCNNGSTASSQVYITDTLHPSMTLQYWWADSGGWVEEYRDSNHLALSRPAIYNGRCERVHIRAHVDENAWPGLRIYNAALVYAASDTTGGDDETWWWGDVNNPHINLNVNKHWNWGQLTPGGELRYNINYHNNGNVPVGAFRITDTLPVSTTFEAAWWYDQYGPHPFPPVETGAGYVVWEFVGLDNGYNDNFEVVLRVGANAIPGTTLVNTAEISRLPGEDSYDDNISAVVETLHDHGPNLRIRKWGDWHGDRPGHAWYQISVENVGDVQIALAVMTDTYPLSMTLEGDPWTDWNRVSDYTRNDAEHWFAFTMENIHLGYRLDFGFNATMAEPVPLGLILTNTAEVTLTAGDANPADNAGEYTLSTGPNLWVNKRLLDGELLPGELITFSLAFGNDQVGHAWWWNLQGNAWLTDTLPDGFELVSAQQHWCGWTDWCDRPPDSQDGHLLTWQLWPLHTGEWNEIYLTVRITDTATGLDTFTNQVEIASDQPDVDIEPYYDDNFDYYDIAIALPYFEVSKAYQSSRVAGMPVTYTLVVTNRGNVDGTDVVLGDKFPAGLTYSDSDGTRVGNSVQWSFASLPTGETSGGWFSGILTCAVGAITNWDYAVIASGEGVTSALGAPVVFDVIAPTISVSLVRNPAAIVAGGTVYLTATVSTNGTPLSYVWNLGAGPVSGGLTASQVYTRNGTYTVVFTATDACGYSQAAQTTVTVNPPTLAAGFNQSAASIIAGGTVYFTDTSTTNGPPIGGWYWTFGDGGASAARNPSHTYTQVGTYTVSLLITDSLGYTDTHTVIDAVAVRAGCTPITGLSFTYAPMPAIVGRAMTFTATYTAGDPAPTFAWSFDGGAPLSGPSVVYTFATTGTHTVIVTATNTCGPVSYSGNITVQPRRIYLPVVMRNG